MKMPTIDYISKRIRKTLKEYGVKTRGSTLLHGVIYEMSKPIKIHWGTKKPRSILMKSIEFGSNDFAIATDNKHYTVNNWRFDSARDIIGLIFKGPA